MVSRCAVVGAILAVSADARAQVRYDTSITVSGSERFLFDRPANTRLPVPGVAATLAGHIALFPLLRVGAYVTADVSPMLDGPSRFFLAAGGRIKVTPPWPRGKWRAWFATGLGYAAASNGDNGGGYFEIPVLVGTSYRFRRPWVVLFELGARFGFAFSGSLYDSVGSAFRGTDVMTLGLGVGIGAGT